MSTTENSPARFVLYSRSYCHLCDDMLHALQAYQVQASFTVEVLDVDTDPEALALYDELVPVLLADAGAGQMQQLCHYFLDHVRVQAFLQLAPTGEAP